jgi:protein-S-isoprenylcysteine O-methyltransferase Ste14
MTKRAAEQTPGSLGAVLRSGVWLAGSLCWAYLKKPSGGSLLDVRADAVGTLGGLLLVAGIGLHAWSNLTLAAAERAATGRQPDLVDGGPFRFVRNPIYLAGMPILLGISLLYGRWHASDVLAVLVLVASFHLLVTHHEEPALRRRLGDRYDEYCRRVPR